MVNRQGQVVPVGLQVQRLTGSQRQGEPLGVFEVVSAWAHSHRSDVYFALRGHLTLQSTVLIYSETLQAWTTDTTGAEGEITAGGRTKPSTGVTALIVGGVASSYIQVDSSSAVAATGEWETSFISPAGMCNDVQVYRVGVLGGQIGGRIELTVATGSYLTTTMQFVPFRTPGGDSSFEWNLADETVGMLPVINSAVLCTGAPSTFQCGGFLLRGTLPAANAAALNAVVYEAAATGLMELDSQTHRD
jgi:hypothetical protein